MFGCYRLVLAFLVVVTHIGKVEVFAGFAVWAFFMLSGFLITGVLNSRYGFDGAGLSGFTVSRVMRLLPAYWLSVVSALLLVHAFRAEVDPLLINSALTQPEGFREWFSAAFVVAHTIFGMGRIDHAPSPSAWAIDVEIWLYVISCVWLSRSMRNARTGLLYALLAFPLLWIVSKYLQPVRPDLAGQVIYSFVPAALLPYAIGVFAWFHRDQRLCRPTVATYAVTSVLVIVLASGVSRVSVTLAYLACLPVFAWTMLACARLETSSPALKKLDEICGHMSYPVYLAHWLAAYIVVVAATKMGAASSVVVSRPETTYAFTGTGFVVIALTTAVIALVVAVVMEVPLERLRHTLAQSVRRNVKRKVPQHV